MPPDSAITELSSSESDAEQRTPPRQNVHPSNVNASPNATISGSSQPSSPHRRNPAGSSTFRLVSSEPEYPPENLLSRIGGLYDPDATESDAPGPSLLDRLNTSVLNPSSSRLRKRPRSPSEEKQTFPTSTEFEASKHRDEELRALLGLPETGTSAQLNGTSAVVVGAEASSSNQDLPDPTAAQPIAEYSCPICFSPPTKACLTSCGHVMCGSCLFSAVKAARERHVRVHGRGPGPDGEGRVFRCPVCRAVMKGWDGKGGGVIGLKLKLAKPAAQVKV